MLRLKRRKLLKLANDDVRPKYLNLGSGPRGVADPHWINVDGYSDTNVQYLMDFTRKWPFSDNSINGIFCEHVFEHFDLKQGEALLSECLRVLSPGGCLRIIVPDGEKIMRTYFDSPAELLAHRPVETSCAMEAVNSYFRQRYEHQCIYDWQLLQYQFSKVGFVQVKQVALNQGSASAAIRLDDERYAWESIYVEAVKPVSTGSDVF